MRDTAETGLNHGIETNHRAVSAELEDAIPLNLHAHKKEGGRRVRRSKIRLAGLRPGNGPDVDMDVFGFLHGMADFDTFHPWMGHDLFCRPP